MLLTLNVNNREHMPIESGIMQRWIFIFVHHVSSWTKYWHKKMKTLLSCLWLFSVWVGNVYVTPKRPYSRISYLYVIFVFKSIYAASQSIICCRSMHQDRYVFHDDESASESIPITNHYYFPLILVPFTYILLYKVKAQLTSLIVWCIVDNLSLERHS